MPGPPIASSKLRSLRLRPDLQVEDEWVTLVNPARDIGRSDIHGIRAGDVAGAPTFAGIAGDAASRLREAIILGHQLRFDRNFLQAEFTRLGVQLPVLPGLCTLAYRLLPKRYARASWAPMRETPPWPR
jgi:DNA polymerase III epsilon subunit-like protein